MATPEEDFAEMMRRMAGLGTTFDDNVKSLQDHKNAVDKGRKSALTLGDSLSRVRDSALKLAGEQKEAQKQADELYKQAKARGVVDKQARQLQQQANAAQTKATELSQKLQQSQGLYNDQLKQFKGAVLTKSLSDIIVAGSTAAIKGQRDIYYAMIDGLQTGQDGVSIASNIMMEQIKRDAAVMGAAAAGVAAAGQTLGGITPGAAAGIEILGKTAGAAVQVMAELNQKGVEVLTKELQRTKTAYTDMTNSGAIFAGGMTEMRNQLSLTGLTLEDYSRVTKNARTNLQVFGGSQVQAMQMVGKVTATMGDGVNRQLRGMGYSNAEISESTAEYMANLQRTGSLAGKSQTDLAKESASYMGNLKIISAITGEDAKAAQKRAQDAAMQSAVQAKLAEMGGNAGAKFQELIKVMPGFEKEIGQLLLTGNTTNAALINSPVLGILQNSIGMIGDQSVQANGAITKSTQDALHANKDALQAVIKEFSAAGIAAMFGQGSEFATQQDALVKIMMQAQRNASQIVEDQNKQKTAPDKLTDSVSGLQSAAEKASIALSNNLTSAVTTFAEKSRKLMEDTDRIVREELKTLIDMVTPNKDRETANRNWNAEQSNTWNNGGQVAAANGAVLSGPASGYKPNLTMHGTEAIVPLANGGVPIESPVMAELLQTLKNTPAGAAINLSPLVEKMTENNQLLRAQVEATRQMRTTLEDGNGINKQILSVAR